MRRLVFASTPLGVARLWLHGAKPVWTPYGDRRAAELAVLAGP
jgi:hypothetical protein